MVPLMQWPRQVPKDLRDLIQEADASSGGEVDAIWIAFCEVLSRLAIEISPELPDDFQWQLRTVAQPQYHGARDFWTENREWLIKHNIAAPDGLEIVRHQRPEFYD